MERSQSFEDVLLQEEPEEAPGLLPGDWKESILNAARQTIESMTNAVVWKLILHYKVFRMKKLFQIVMALHTIHLYPSKS